MAVTLGTVWDRISALVVAQGYVRSTDAFDFDMQPDGKHNKAFCLSSERGGTDGYLGGDQAETHVFTIYLAQRISRDVWGAVRQLKADMDAVEAAVAADYATYDYNLQDDGVSSECRTPPDTADFVVGQLQLSIEFDRIM